MSFGTEIDSFTCVTMCLREVDVDSKVKKVKLFLCLSKHHAMNTYWESEDISSLILDLSTRWR
jgi:hypothetical protein